LLLYARTIWDKYQLTSLAGGEKTNALITERKSVMADSTDYEDPARIARSLR